MDLHSVRIISLHDDNKRSARAYDNCGLFCCRSFSGIRILHHLFASDGFGAKRIPDDFRSSGHSLWYYEVGYHLSKKQAKERSK